jgi:Na+/H+ ion antiporter subunit
VSRVRGAAHLAGWWLLLSAGYLGLLSSPTGWEIPRSLVIGGAAAVAGMLGRRAFDPAVRAPGFTRGAVWLPVDIVSDTVALTRLLLTGRALRDDAGETDVVLLPDDDEATRAWAVLLTSAAPGSLTVDVERSDGRPALRRHLLSPSGRATAGLETR